MNSTRGSTPPNPNFDLPNRSMDLNKTLGIIGTPHEESIAMILSTKTCQIKRNRRNPAKNSSNPRTLKTPKSSPLDHGFRRGITAQRTTKGSHKFPPTNPQEQGPDKQPKRITKRGLRKSPPRTTGNNTSKPRGTTPNHLYMPQRFIQGLACRPIIQPSQQDLTMKLSS
jgi:hypothetical protein